MMIGLAYTVMIIIEDKLSLGSIVSNQPAISCTSSPIPIGGDERDQEGGGGGTGRLGGGGGAQADREGGGELDKGSPGGVNPKTTILIFRSS
jgi:hypothetical protein